MTEDVEQIKKPNEFVLQHKWIPLTDRQGVKYLFPESVREYLPGRQDCPGIYRWSFLRGTGESAVLVQVLIGESKSLLRRLGEYVRPTTKEEAKWSEFFHKEVESGIKD